MPRRQLRAERARLQSDKDERDETIRVLKRSLDKVRADLGARDKALADLRQQAKLAQERFDNELSQAKVESAEILSESRGDEQRAQAAERAAEKARLFGAFHHDEKLIQRVSPAMR